MDKLSINFEDNFYTVFINNKNILFNYNLLYILDLESPYKYTYLTDIEQIREYKNYIIFCCEFRDDINFLNKVKNELNSEFINFSLECFWYYYKKNDIQFENLDLAYDNLEIDPHNNFQFDNKNIQDTLLKLEKEVKSYKTTILNESLENIFNKFENLNNQVIIFQENLNKKEPEFLKLKNIQFKNDYSIDRENELEKIRGLIEFHENINTKIKELENEYLKMEDKLNKQIRDLETKYLYAEEQYKSLTTSDKFLNIPITINDKKEWREMAITLHLYDISLWDEIYSFIKNLDGFNLKIDMYVNISVNNQSILESFIYKKLIDKIKSCKMFQNIFFTYSNNCGMDIGGFFYSYNKMIDLGLRYHQIIKIHSKTNKNWRYAMLYALLGNRKIIMNNLNSMSKPLVGMIGNEKLSLNQVLAVNKKSYRYLFTYQKYFGVKKNLNNYGYFIPGTIFWVKGEIFDKYFTKELLVKCYNEFEQNYCGSLINNKEGKPHAFERFFGMLVQDFGKKVITYDTKL